MPSLPPAQRASRPDDLRRAILLSILCSCALILSLALLARLFLPQGSGSGSGTGLGAGQGSGTSAQAGTGGAGVGTGGGSSGTGAGGDGLGDSPNFGTETGTVEGQGTTAGTAVTPGGSSGQPAGDDRPAGVTTEANPASAGGIKTSATPPPILPTSPKEPVVLALGDFKSAPSASVGSGPAAGGPAGPAFFGSRGRGTKFVYIVDRSGSMHGDRFEAASNELKKSIKSLRPNMTFHVIFYDNLTDEMPSKALLPGTPENIDRALKWIDTITPRGGTEPGDALVTALKMKPDTIWLLTDGEFDDIVAEQVTAANPERKVAINTIAIHEKSGEPLLKRIAKENRGDYTYIAPPSLSPSGPLNTSPLSPFDKFFNKTPKP